MVSASFWEQSLGVEQVEKESTPQSTPTAGLGRPNHKVETQGQGSTRSVLVHPSVQCLGFLSSQILKLTHSAQN